MRSREEAPHAGEVPPPDDEESGGSNPPVHAACEHAHQHHDGLVVNEEARGDQLGKCVARVHGRGRQQTRSSKI